MSHRVEEERVALDYPGLAMMALCLVSFLLALSWGEKTGWYSPLILSLSTLAIFSLFLFIVIELKSQEPIIPLSMFLYPSFRHTCLVTFLHGAALMGTNSVIVIFLQKVLGLGPAQVGLLLLPATLLRGVGGLWAGRISDKIDPRGPIIFGLLTFSLVISRFTQIDEVTALVFVGGMLALHSFTGACVGSPLTAAALRSLPEKDVRIGSGLLNLMTIIGGTAGIAASGAILVRREATYRLLFGTRVIFLAYNDYFLIVSLLLAATVIPAVFVKGRRVSED